jgi:enterochelin esterase-like enzyme
MPAIDKEYYTDTAASGRATIGISNGGNAALWLTVNHPWKFGKVAAMSSNVIPEVSLKVSGSPKMDIDIYLDMGTYDIPVLIPMVDDFARLLKIKGYTFTYYKWHEGHSWGNWKGHLCVALKQFFPN